MAAGKIDSTTHANLLESDARFRFETTLNASSRETVDRRRAQIAPPSPAASEALKKAYRLYATGKIGLGDYEAIAEGDTRWRVEEERYRSDFPEENPPQIRRKTAFFDGSSCDGDCLFLGCGGNEAARAGPRRATWAPEPILVAASAPPIDAAEWDLERTLCHPTTSRLFEEFVEKEHAAELLDFVKELGALRRLRDEAERVPFGAVEAFFASFLDPNAESCVNVSSRRVDAARRTLAKNEPMVSLAEFEGAADDLKAEVLFDIFARFQRSGLWRSWATPRACPS